MFQALALWRQRGVHRTALTVGFGEPSDSAALDMLHKEFGLVTTVRREICRGNQAGVYPPSLEDLREGIPFLVSSSWHLIVAPARVGCASACPHTLR